MLELETWMRKYFRNDVALNRNAVPEDAESANKSFEKKKMLQKQSLQFVVKILGIYFLRIMAV